SSRNLMTAPDARSEEDVRLPPLVDATVAAAVDDAPKFNGFRRAHEELQCEDRLKLLIELTNHVVSNLDLRDILHTLSGSLRRALQCDAVAVHLPDLESNRLRPYGVECHAGNGSLKDDTFPLIDGSAGCHAGEAFRTAQPTVMSQHGSDPHPMVSGEGIKSSCALPLISRSRILGVLELRRH